MTKEFDNAMHHKVRKALLTVWSTGKLVKNPWFLQGLDSDEKTMMLNDCSAQVFLLYDHYNKGNVVHITIKRCISLVKNVIYFRAKKHLENDLHVDAEKKFEVIGHLFRVQLGEEETWYTKRDVKVSEYIVRNYDNDDIFKKFKKKSDGWYAHSWTTKFKYVDPDRTRYLKSGKQERFNILDNRVGSLENEWVNDCMLWEHLVDCYSSYKVPYQASYGDIILAYNEEKSAPYCQKTARNKLKDFFLKAFLLYGVSIQKEDANFHRDCTEMLDVYCTLDMFLRERKRGYSVADILLNR